MYFLYNLSLNTMFHTVVRLALLFQPVIKMGVTGGTGKFVSKKIRKVRWRPRQDSAQATTGMFATGSWDEEINEVAGGLEKMCMKPSSLIGFLVKYFIDCVFG